MARPAESGFGHIVISYSRLDWTLGAFIGRLVNPDLRVGDTITAAMTIGQKITLLGELFRLLESYRPGADHAALDEALSEASAAVEEGNTLLHSTWWDV